MPGWTKDTNVKKDGEKILNNYKKQLAEKLAREAAEDNRTVSNMSRASGRSSKMSV